MCGRFTFTGFNSFTWVRMGLGEVSLPLRYCCYQYLQVVLSDVLNENLVRKETTDFSRGPCSY